MIDIEKYQQSLENSRMHLQTEPKRLIPWLLVLSRIVLAAGIKTSRHRAQLFRCFAVCIIAGLVSSCGLFDSGVEWRGGPYALVWIDTSEDLSVCRKLAGGNWIGRVDSTVFAVGWDGRYLVAKQHPQNDRSKTNYFIVDARSDTEYADPGKVVIGPLTAAEFQRKSVELHLPAFSKVMKSLQ